eukprot:TRINITY_DN163_c0_g1_i1.p1 TRINITY_DN163_c0_g1~~TRINITY_DN163_c0_g1_i1.p1  ORF type:complete len:772 (+),score=219.57 TRINITY_DN163_c0_g1_i1:206-2521(+)
MGKKGKGAKNATSKKGKSLLAPESVEERNRVVNFLKDMFPSLDEGLIRMIYDENEQDQEKSITQLSALSETNEFDPNDYTDENISSEEATPHTSPRMNQKQSPKHTTNPGTTTSHTSTTSTTSTTHSNSNNSRQDFSQTQSTEKQGKSNFKITSDVDIFEDDFMERWACLLDENPVKEEFELTSQDDGGLDFIKTSFPEMDTAVLQMIYEENGFDIEQTVEHVLSLLFINSMDQDKPDNVAEEESDKFKTEESGSENEDFENIENVDSDFEIVPNLDTQDNLPFKPQIPFKLETLSDEEQQELISGSDKSLERTYQFENLEISSGDNENGGISSGEEEKDEGNGAESLTILTEMFPSLSRQAIVMCANENEWDIEKTVDVLMLKIGGSPPPRPKSKKEKKKDKKKGKAQSANNTVDYDSSDERKSDNIGRYGGKKGKRSLTTANYSKFGGKPAFKARNLKDSKEYPQISPNSPSSRTTFTTSPPNSPDALDIASKLKLTEISKMFVGTLPLETIQDVFLQCDKKLGLTLTVLYNLVPSKNLNFNKNQPREEAFNERSTQNTNSNINASSSSSNTNQQRNREAQNIAAAKIDWEQVEAKKKPVNLNKPEYVHSSQQVSLYDQYRKSALNYSVARNQCFKYAAQAYSRGMNAEAVNFRERARSYDEMAMNYRLDAVRQLFYDNNNLREGILTIDLHGFLAQEAIEVIEKVIELHRMDPRTVTHLNVITGRGLHSRGGVAKIKPAVQKYFEQKEIRFTETNPGSTLVKLKRHIR